MELVFQLKETDAKEGSKHEVTIDRDKCPHMDNTGSQARLEAYWIRLSEPE